MVLSDKEIVQELLNEKIIITPLLRARKQIGSSSIDVRLGTEFRYIKTAKQSHFDLSLVSHRLSTSCHSLQCTIALQAK